MSMFTWLVTALLMVVWILSFSNPKAANVTHKLYLMFFGLINMLLTPDKKWPKQSDPDNIKDVPGLTKKRIIVVRHAESEWNSVFNRGFGPSFPGRVISAVLREIQLLQSKDSVFFDSPINTEGMQASKDVEAFIYRREETHSQEVQEALEILRGEKGTSVICSSNLRRCIETTVLVFYRRLQMRGEAVHILSSLQEISFNIDCVALAPPGVVPDLHHIDKLLPTPFDRYDVSSNLGNKPIFGTGLARMLDFCMWCFGREEDTIIVAGHSLYWRFFFKTFLPHNFQHTAKLNKMSNTGIVMFDLQRAPTANGPVYRIVPESLRSVYLGWETKYKGGKKNL
eukprot:gb/GEZN01008906.1/.p1 GENE.gb/GEZN01008906.1/~~gb/GEZN01008906.1/.p1  ORF type:complete len:340 (+),score=32.50 gb/GEZN01008906.1/:50-1069(+)